MPYPLSNLLIDALPPETRRKFLAETERVSLPKRAPLYEPGEAPRYVHFLTSGIASIVTLMSTGDTTEVATVGREGLPQGLHLLGELCVPTRCFMQISGMALRMEFRTLQEFFETEPAVHRGLLAYSQYHSLLLSQIAGCNRLHGVNARLARWLLMVQDRTAADLLKLTQEFLAQMIGSQRTTVSTVAGALQARGLIDFSRGNVRIIDRVGLEKAACECYPVTRSLLAGMYSRAHQSLFAESGENLGSELVTPELSMAGSSVRQKDRSV